MSEIIKNRYEFLILFDVENGNPNGDPDAGNMPRIDPETGHGIVTDVCIKRKIRNYVEIKMKEKEGYKIYLKEGVVLNEQHALSYKALNEEIRNSSQKPSEKAVKWMCENFYDIRTFGAVMTTEVNCGQIRGPVQLSFARSIDPIMPQEITITRVAITKGSDAENKETEMGRKHIVPYALYKMEGYVSAALADKNGNFTEEDVELLWEAVENMFEHDRSASKGNMVLRKLIIFKHDSILGNAPAHKLFESVEIKKKENIKAPRNYEDYIVNIKKDLIPQGVTLIERV
ncbi:CRISPR-associated protein, Csd2 family [Caloramator quimbayensis]|uniref:CRISPR-associated protein, Csd2 family n=1 Tax=Caloramator quimbayensis TaxID=1147123 RepID=A0A1T4WLM4_9CLOT|nr:type I-C CRISPR-associated protein Cas7/Csd2 [Caloramator quimbayensis]SKA78256.1 CRISPR-associated protein, Csd2 family [Caloramator quimbayensis]